MAFLDLDGRRCYYRLEGRADRPVLALAHSLGLDHSMWDPQMPGFLERFRVLRYDIRGHGASDAPDGEYSIEALGQDALRLIDRLGLATVAWCAVSLGGMIGQWLGAHAGGRLSALVLANTSPRIADPAGMESRRRTVLAQGIAAIADVAMERFFGPTLLRANPPAVASARETLLSTSPVGYAGCCAALREFDGRAALARIRTRTLVIGGDADTSMPWESHGAVLGREIPDAETLRLGAAHLSSLGLPRTFTRAVQEFLIRSPHGAHEAPLDVRRAVLGAEYVARKIESTTPLTHDFQDLITRYAWGEIWSRPGIDRLTRRLLVLATTAALARWDEFHMHLRAGLDDGLEWSDVEEVLLQAAVYAGVPVANTAFRIAQEELDRRRTPAG